jgi:hypothetical protein
LPETLKGTRIFDHNASILGFYTMQGILGVLLLGC